MKKMSLLEVFDDGPDDEDVRVQRNLSDPKFREDLASWRRDYAKKFPSPEELHELELKKLDKKIEEINNFLNKLKQERFEKAKTANLSSNVDLSIDLDEFEF